MSEVQASDSSVAATEGSHRLAAVLVPLVIGLISLAEYWRTASGSHSGETLLVCGIALVALGKWFLSPRVALYVEADQHNSSGRLAVKPVSGTSIATAYMAGINLHF